MFQIYWIVVQTPKHKFMFFRLLFCMKSIWSKMVQFIYLNQSLCYVRKSVHHAQFHDCKRWCDERLLCAVSWAFHGIVRHFICHQLFGQTPTTTTTRRLMNWVRCSSVFYFWQISWPSFILCVRNHNLLGFFLNLNRTNVIKFMANWWDRNKRKVLDMR